MTTAILAVIALSGPLASAAKPEFRAQTDYGQAMKVATGEKKPMAVLIGKGDVFAKMMADPKLTAEAKKLLAEKYVCLTIDVSTDAGKTLAGQFQMSDGGLVISSAGGSHQALRHSGTVSAMELSQYAPTYAGVSGLPSTTVTAGFPASTSSYVAPSFVPATYAPSSFAPSSGNYIIPSSFGAPRCTSYG
jgi:hypothetical protein